MIFDTSSPCLLSRGIRLIHPITHSMYYSLTLCLALLLAPWDQRVYHPAVLYVPENYEEWAVQKGHGLIHYCSFRLDGRRVQVELGPSASWIAATGDDGEVYRLHYSRVGGFREPSRWILLDVLPSRSPASVYRMHAPTGEPITLEVIGPQGDGYTARVWRW